MAHAEVVHDEHFGSTVNGTDDREAHPKRWVAALVQVRNEKAVSKKLESLGIENWVPTQVEVHQWSDRKKKVERVVIPMIVFIRAEESALKSLAYHSFIYKLVTLPGQRTPAIIPDSQIDSLRFMLKQTEMPVEMVERVFKTGDHVRIARGPLKDLEGELCMVEDHKPMVAVLIHGLGYACVSIDKSDILLIHSILSTPPYDGYCFVHLIVNINLLTIVYEDSSCRYRLCRSQYGYPLGTASSCGSC